MTGTRPTSVSGISAPPREELAAAKFADDVAEMITRAVERSGNSQIDIADSMGISAGRVSQLLSGDGNVRAATLGRLADALGVELQITVNAVDASWSVSLPKSEPTAFKLQTARRRRAVGNNNAAVEIPRPPAGELAAARLCDDLAELVVAVDLASGRDRRAIAEQMGVTESRISQILSGEGNFRMSTLAKFAAACGAEISAAMDVRDDASVTDGQETFLGGDKGTPEDADSAAVIISFAEARRKMQQRAPIRELQKRGYLPAEDPSGADIATFCEFFEVRGVDEEFSFPAAARRHNSKESVSEKQKIWLACARAAAKKVEVTSPFDSQGLSRVAAELTQKATQTNEFADLPRRLCRVGVKLVYVEPFNGNKISGASFYGADGSPVIALSGRGKRLDHVLFTLLHECAHLVLGHVSPTSITIDDDDDEVGTEMESAANLLAHRWQFPFPVRTPKVASKQWLEDEARDRGIPPIVIFGYLQHSGRLRWNARVTVDAPHVISFMEEW